jgi:alpha-tubulin suppressor-like RCC1 family protein
VRAVGSSTLETHARRARKALVVALLLARAPIAAAKKLLLTSDSASCALDDAGLMKCWGGNEYGALGNANLGTGNTNYGSNIYLAPVVVGNGLGEVIDETTHVFNEGDVEVIAGGWLHHCALEREQSGGTKVWCWGYNGYGQVGDGTTTSRKVPVLVREHANGPALTGVSSLVLGWDITCAAMSAGGVMCWGRNEANLGYACGDGTTGHKSNPVWVKMSDYSDLQGVVRELYVGQFHSCVLFEDDLDRLVCWGMQTWGIANPDVDPATTTNDGMARFMAKEITYFKDRGKRVKSLGLGSDHTCALLTTGTVECWGVNDYGQLGVNCGVNSYTPAQVPGLSGVASIDGGNRFTCVIISFTGEVKCWGNNALNQLGSGFPDNYYGSEASEASAYCGVTSSVRTSSVANIGTNGNPGARVLAVSWYHTCATMSDFTIRCWGNNPRGQLGDHQTEARTEPVTVLLSTGSPGVNFIAFDTRGACGCCDDMMKARGFHTDCKA